MKRLVTPPANGSGVSRQARIELNRPVTPPPVSFRATLACFSVPSDPTPTPTPEPTPTPTPTPDPCADWEAPPLISDSGSSPASFRGHSGEWYVENPPEEAELDEDDLNILEPV